MKVKHIGIAAHGIIQRAVEHKIDNLIILGDSLYLHDIAYALHNVEGSKLIITNSVEIQPRMEPEPIIIKAFEAVKEKYDVYIKENDKPWLTHREKNNYKNKRRR